MDKQTTLRLVIPQWQGGVNPNYVLGAQLLATLAPENSDNETVTIPVSQNYTAPLKQVHGIDRFDELMDQTKTTLKVLTAKNPAKVITFGGDCSVSQAPFAYLSEKYGKDLGILWLDAHPDVATTKNSSHLHEMVLGNLLGDGAPEFAATVAHPISVNRVMLGGLITTELRPGLDDEVKNKHISTATPEMIVHDHQVLTDWLSKNKIKKLAVHFDLDVLSPKSFRSIYPAEPGTKLADFPAAVGKLTLSDVVKIFTRLNEQVDLVGLTLAEHLPWDAINLRNALSQIDIFN